MTKEQALELIKQYCKILENFREPDTVLTELVKRWPEDGSEAKAMRWLGFIQGALYAYGYYSLEEVKDHSREKKVKESPSPYPYNYHL